MKHELKVWTEYFEDIFTGKKKFDLRFNDRPYQIGDSLRLMEYNNIENMYTGRECVREINYILSDTKFGLKEGWIIVGLDFIVEGVVLC